MLVETEVLRSTAPICSAIDMKRLPKTSSRTGSAASARDVAARAPCSSRSRSTPSSSTRSAKPGSSTTRAGRFEDQRGPRERVPGREVLAPVDRRRDAAALREPDRLRRRGCAAALARERRARGGTAAPCSNTRTRTATISIA